MASSELDILRTWLGESSDGYILIEKIQNSGFALIDNGESGPGGMLYRGREGTVSLRARAVDGFILTVLYQPKHGDYICLVDNETRPAGEEIPRPPEKHPPRRWWQFWKRGVPRPSDKTIMREMRALEVKHKTRLAVHEAVSEQEMDFERYMDILLDRISAELAPKYELNQEEFMDLYIRMREQLGKRANS